jgi:leucyl aminopeptidase
MQHEGWRVPDLAGSAQLQQLWEQGDFQAKQNDTMLVYGLPELPARRVLLLGLGKAEDFSVQTFGQAVEQAVRTLQAGGMAEAVLCLPTGTGINPATLARHAVLATDQALYRFDQCKSKPQDTPDTPFSQLTILTADEPTAVQTAVAQTAAALTGLKLTKDLANLPGNLCTPSILAEQAQQLSEQYADLDVSVLDEPELEALGMGSFLSVSRGSQQPAKLIVLRYTGGPADAAPIALVGKAVTFDAGGISLKPAAKMDEMKFDMCGGASVLGVLAACAAQQLPINVIGIVPSSENLPGGQATKPGDIVTSMSGQTIEILNTDAEGRLLLCDALTYTERFKPAAVIDIATLTGACVVALGHEATGLMANDADLAQAILAAGETAQDRAWQLPLWDDYAAALKSNFADVANVGDRAAGTITAALFLSRFTKKFRWAHLDIAGTAWHSGKKKGATGRPVLLLLQFLQDYAAGKISF